MIEFAEVGSTGILAPKKALVPRRIVQFAQDDKSITALAHDGTLWIGYNAKAEGAVAEVRWTWTQLAALPPVDG